MLGIREYFHDDISLNSFPVEFKKANKIKHMYKKSLINKF